MQRVSHACGIPEDDAKEVRVGSLFKHELFGRRGKGESLVEMSNSFFFLCSQITFYLFIAFMCVDLYAKANL